MSTFGSVYKTSTFGESHCKSVGVIIDGVPPGLAISEQDIQTQLSRRRPGQSELTTPRNEADSVTILRCVLQSTNIRSGIEMGYSLGTPVAMLVNNKDHKPQDYGEMDYYPRPSHADYTYLLKYGIKASSGVSKYLSVLTSRAVEVLQERQLYIIMSSNHVGTVCS
jgi:chorismate synthase